MSVKSINKPSKKIYVPSSFTVIFIIMLVFIIISWIGGAINSGIKPLGLLDIFPAAWRGFIDKAPVIIFIFAIGGTLGVMTQIRAIDAGIQALVLKLKGKEWLLIVTLTFVFGINGTTYGLWEEVIVFFPVLIPIFIKANYGAFIAVATILIGCGTGVLASTINPFAIGTGIEAINDTGGFQDKFTVALGQGQRWIIFIIFETIASMLLLFIAKQHKKQQGKVKGLNNDLIQRKFLNNQTYVFTLKRKLVVILFAFGFIIMILGFLPWNSILGIGQGRGPWDKFMWWLASTNGTWETLGSWTFISATGIFLIVTLIIFALNWNEFKTVDNNLNEQIEAESNVEQNFINTYTNGIKDMVPVVLLIGLASGLGIILQQSNIGALVAKSIAWMASYNLIVWGLVVFIISLFLAFLIPSTSGFASAFIGIFALSVGQAVPDNNVDGALALTLLACVFASGMINLWSPTSPALVAYLNYCKIPYITWIKQTYLIQVTYFSSAILLIIIIGSIGNNGIIF